MREKTESHEPRKYDYIDAMRGIAILMVLTVHSGQQFPLSEPARTISAMGQLGVQLFFVASALTLCLSWTSREDETERVPKFLIRRYFRIAPMYYAGTLVYFLNNVVRSHSTVHAALQDYTPLNVLANVFFVHGLVPSANNTIVPGGWSI